MHLDLRSLNSAACVCTLLYNACKDPLLFTSVNLKVFIKYLGLSILNLPIIFLYCMQPYWYCVDSTALDWLSARSRLLTELDLSWCGAYGKFGPVDLIK